FRSLQPPVDRRRSAITWAVIYLLSHRQLQDVFIIHGCPAAQITTTTVPCHSGSGAATVPGDRHPERLAFPDTERNTAPAGAVAAGSGRAGAADGDTVQLQGWCLTAHGAALVRVPSQHRDLSTRGSSHHSVCRLLH